MTILIIHGGAGAREGTHAKFVEYAEHLKSIVDESYTVLLQKGAREAALYALRYLEDDPIFNAGTGSRLQKDGRVRMSAALMDSLDRSFSGVINIERVQHPIEVAERLAKARHPVLAGELATAFARQQGFLDYDPVTEHRQREYEQKAAGRSGTVGAVALDAGGVICAATSTGGVGYETPGRVSDSATVAGTYASPAAGISCTGIGEHIVNHAAAARIVCRIEDGITLVDAIGKTIAEADGLNYKYGLIGLDRHGNWSAQQTRSVTTLFAVHDGRHSRTFLD